VGARKFFMKKFLFLFFCFVLAGIAFSQEMSYEGIFDSTWSAEEIESLERGEIVIRNIGKMKRRSIKNGLSPFVDEMIGDFEEVNPNYLAEIIYKMPAEKNESVIEQAVDIFSDISLYKEIIYTDEKKDKSTPLFPLTELVEREDSNGEIRIASHLRMDMLSDYGSELVIKSAADDFFFEQRNTTPLKWHSITAVGAQKMVAGICCFKYGESYYVYALGGIRAPRIPLVMREIDRQFLGRIEDFTVFYISRFEIARP